jgi:hypothetical protein
MLNIQITCIYARRKTNKDALTTISPHFCKALVRRSYTGDGFSISSYHYHDFVDIVCP